MENSTNFFFFFCQKKNSKFNYKKLNWYWITQSWGFDNSNNSNLSYESVVVSDNSILSFLDLLKNSKLRYLKCIHVKKVKIEFSKIIENSKLNDLLVYLIT